MSLLSPLRSLNPLHTCYKVATGSCRQIYHTTSMFKRREPFYIYMYKYISWEGLFLKHGLSEYCFVFNSGERFHWLWDNSEFL